MNVLDTIIDLQFLKDRNACDEGIKYFEEEIKEPILARELIEKLLATKKREKMGWVSWLLCKLFSRPHYIQYAVFAAEQVLPIFEKEYPDDKLPREAIEAAKQVALNDNGENRKIAADAANAAANAAAYAANAANAAYVAANATYAAANATYAAYAADDAADAAAYAVDASDVAANAVAYTAGGKEMLLKIISFGIGLLENKR